VAVYFAAVRHGASLVLHDTDFLGFSQRGSGRNPRGETQMKHEYYERVAYSRQKEQERAVNRLRLWMFFIGVVLAGWWILWRL
jgi:hypothetical protein